MGDRMPGRRVGAKGPLGSEKRPAYALAGRQQGPRQEVEIPVGAGRG